MIIELIESNFIGIIIVLFLILFILTNNNFEKRTNRLFLISAFIIFILIIEEAWEAELAKSLTFEFLRIPLSALGYTLRPAIPFILIFIIKKYSKKDCLLLSIPLIINGLVAFSSLFCDISFSYSETNEFIRGSLGYLPFAIAAFYMIWALIVMERAYKDLGIAEMMIITAIVILSFTATILESLLHIRFIQCPCMATSLTFFYLFLHSNQNNRDTLTGALTRRKFHLDSKKHYSTLTAVVSLDLNNLKEINDQFTHIKGDEALALVVKTAKKHLGLKAVIYRTGGDEFMILCYKMSEADVKKMILLIKNDLEKTEYKCAIGYAMKSNSIVFDTLCQNADNMMYENKREMKN